MSGGGAPVALAIIVAAADNDVIGRDNQLLWRLRTDMRRFRSLTMGHPVLMGRKTFESIGKPLAGRETIVLTRGGGELPPDIVRASSLDEALALGREAARRLGVGRLMVAGGAQVYAECLPLADEILLTRVHAAPAGDAVFPAINPEIFAEASREAHPAGAEDEHAFTFINYKRKRERSPGAPTVENR
ncbi:dihydrofolate reductase [Chelatococcus daeguensis]|uniref:Dihydrofolate reductase n=2 Tax=Chelatococcus TaxID=28209 RepID=A0AAC9NZ34_9HYPH|nr:MULTISPECIES: dihydrofolate reductase [Chelatococcus]APF38047.1 diacylglycerol kinase [Chelatococcus daeguensis]KZE28552.1 diacylglycerol kinase [Chelatococcus daeguensis]MBM3083513.1 dihydrofolate reductase [Chelatococcus daeguensis]CUA84122.1 Dihydrofolate reductase [Chelatococcus sambhunathii]